MNRIEFNIMQRLGKAHTIRDIYFDNHQHRFSVTRRRRFVPPRILEDCQV